MVRLNRQLTRRNQWHKKRFRLAAALSQQGIEEYVWPAMQQVFGPLTRYLVPVTLLRSPDGGKWNVLAHAAAEAHIIWVTLVWGGIYLTWNPSRRNIYGRTARKTIPSSCVLGKSDRIQSSYFDVYILKTHKLDSLLCSKKKTKVNLHLLHNKWKEKLMEGT